MNEVFVKLANMSVAAGWLILAVLVLRLLLKKAPRWITCLLWALVAVRLVCPVSFLSPVSAYQVAAPSAVQESGSVEYFQYVHAGGDKPSIQWDMAGLRPAEIAPVQQETAAADTSRTVTLYMPPFVTIWLAVGGALLLYGLASTLRLRYRVREGMCLRENIWLCDAVTSPFLLGILRPRIYLPSGMDERQMDYVLAHEQAHLHRGDQVWKPLGHLLLAVHWFNPLVWVAYWLFCRDIEAACDERVVRSMGVEDKKAYSMALLTCSQGRRMVLACPVAFGEVGVKSRIKAVLHYKKPSFWMVLAAVLVCIVVAVCFLTDPVGKTGDKGTLTFVEKENVVSTWRADFAVDTKAAALDAEIYAEVWRNGQCETTRLLTMGSEANELSVQIEQPERNLQTLPVFRLWATTDVYGGYGELSDGLKEMPKDTAFAAYGDGEKRQVAAGDDIVLLAMAADFGGGLPQFDCRKLEKQPDIAQKADYMIVVRGAFAAGGTTPQESILGKDTDSAHEYLLPLFRQPVEVELDGVAESDSIRSLDALINDHHWAMPANAVSTGATPAITLYARSGDTLRAESGMDALLWVNADGDAVAYVSDLTGDEIVDALSGWAWRVKKGISRSRELVPDAETFFTRFVNGDFRGDIYAAQEFGGDQMPFFTLMDMLTDYVSSHTLTDEQYRILMLNTDGLDGAYASGYGYVLEQAYQRDPEAYLRVWNTLTYDQQKAIPWGEEGILPRPAELRWSYDAAALDAPYMTVNGSGRVFYMEVPDDLVTRIRQRAAEHVTLGGFEPPADTHGWLRPLNSWTAERPEVHLIFTEDSPRETYSLLRGDGGVWGIGTESGAVQADAEVRELLSMIASLTGWQTTSGRESFSNLTAAELIYNGKVLHTVTDADQLMKLQYLLQNGTQDSFASKTPMERVQLRMTHSDGSTVSVLLDTDNPRIYLPPFYYYEYNDYESTGTQPLLDALGLTAWPAAVADENAGEWLTALEAQLTPMPRAAFSGASLSFPLSEETVNDTLTAVGLPLRVDPRKTQSYADGQIVYTLRGEGEDLYPWGAVHSAVYDGGKRVLTVIYLEEAAESTVFRWEDAQRAITLANTLWGGFSDDGQLYRQLSALPIPQDAANGASWALDTGNGYWRVTYTVSTIQEEPNRTNLTIACYESEAEYHEIRKQAQQQWETAVSAARNQLPEQTGGA